MNGINQMHEENKVVAAAASNDDDDNMHLNLPHHYLADADFDVYADLPKPTKNVVSDSAWTQTHSFQIPFPFLTRPWATKSQASSNFNPHFSLPSRAF